MYAVLCLVTQSCPSLCDLMDCSLPGSSVYGDSPRKTMGVGCHFFLQRIFPTQGSNPRRPHCRQIVDCLSHQGSPRILEWVAYSLSRGSSHPGMNWGLLHCRQTFYQLNYQGSPYIYIYIKAVGFPGETSGKEHTCQCWRHKRCGFNPWAGKILWRRK